MRERDKLSELERNRKRDRGRERGTERAYMRSSASVTLNDKEKEVRWFCA